MAAQSDKSIQSLFEAVLELRDINECRRFFSDLCTPSELCSLSDRWRVARLIQEGVPYRSIYEQTGVSTATVTRVARALAHGDEGYRIVLGRVGGAKARVVRSSKKGGTYA